MDLHSLTVLLQSSALPFQSLAVPAILFLAFIGYVTCLSRFLWIALILTGAFAGYVALAYPITGETQVYWLVGSGIGLGALALSRMYKPANSRQPAGAASSGADRNHTMGQSHRIVLDGTNVMHWDGEGADLETLRIVIDTLKHRQFDPYVFLDASSRHHLGDKSLNERGFARKLGLPQKRVMVCPAETEADAFILKFARQEGLAVVSNDRFSDRAEQKKGLKLVKGVITNGKPIFEGL